MWTQRHTVHPTRPHFRQRATADKATHLISENTTTFQKRKFSRAFVLSICRGNAFWVVVVSWNYEYKVAETKSSISALLMIEKWKKNLNHWTVGENINVKLNFWSQTSWSMICELGSGQWSKTQKMSVLWPQSIILFLILMQSKPYSVILDICIACIIFYYLN